MPAKKFENEQKNEGGDTLQSNFSSKKLHGKLFGPLVMLFLWFTLPFIWWIE